MCGGEGVGEKNALRTGLAARMSGGSGKKTFFLYFSRPKQATNLGSAGTG